MLEQPDSNFLLAVKEGLSWTPGAELTVALLTEAPTYSNSMLNDLGNSTYQGFVSMVGEDPLRTAQRTQVINALASWADVANLNFRFVEQTPSAPADLTFGFVDMPLPPSIPAGVVFGGALSPDSTQGPAAGDVWLNTFPA